VEADLEMRGLEIFNTNYANLANTAKKALKIRIFAFFALFAYLLRWGQGSPLPSWATARVRPYILS